MQMSLERHREIVLRLWTENMSDPVIASVARRRLRWFYEENPEGAPETSLVLENGTQEIVGCGSFYPRAMVVDEKMWRVGILSDFAVTPAHRLAGPAVILQRSLINSHRLAGVDFLITYPNRNAESIFKRVGYKVIGGTTTWVKVLRSRREVSKRVKSSLMRNLVAGAIDTGLAFLDVVRHLKANRNETRKLVARSADAPDQRFEELAESTERQHRIEGVRSVAYLDWRYRRFHSNTYRFFYLEEAVTRRIAGYLVYTTKDGDVTIADLLTEGRGPIVERLLIEFAAFQRRAGSSSIRATYIGADEFGERLKALGFIQRPNQRSLLAYFGADTPAELKETVLEKKNWLMFDPELDI